MGILGLTIKAKSRGEIVEVMVLDKTIRNGYTWYLCLGSRGEVLLIDPSDIIHIKDANH